MISVYFNVILENAKYKSLTTAYPINMHNEKVKNRRIPFVQPEVTCDSYPVIYRNLSFKTVLCLWEVCSSTLKLYFIRISMANENKICVIMLSMSTGICKQ